MRKHKVPKAIRERMNIETREIPTKKPSMASFKTAVKSIGEAILDLAKNGIEPVTEQEFKERHDICKECEYYVPTSEYGRCAKCSCFLKYKPLLKAWHCPVNKW